MLMKKYFKWAGIVVLVPVLLVLILFLLFYFPPFQNWAVKQVASYASEKTQLDIRVEHVNLEFPLNLGIDGIHVIQQNDSLPQVKDTVADIRKTVVDIQLLPLLDTVLALYSKGLSFADTTVEQYHDFDAESADGTTVFIIGSPDSGKSALAEKTVSELSDPDHRIYIATMIPYGEEGRERVRRHRMMRDGKGFITIEAPFDICSSLSDYNMSNGGRLDNMTVLLECLSNLVANELFERRSDRDEMLGRLYEDIRWIAQRAGNLVIVSNHFETEESFDDETRFYAETLDMLNEMISGLADKTIRI